MTGARQWGCLLLCLLTVILAGSAFEAQASQSDGAGGSGSVIGGLMGMEEEWQELDQFLQRETGQAGGGYSFTEMVKMLMSGEGNELVRNLLDTLKEYLLAEVSQGGKIVAQLLALGLIGAVFSNFSDIFTGSQLSETGFFMTYLLSFVILAAGFSDSVEIARAVMEKQVEFFNVLIPSYFLTVAWSGGSMSSIAWYEVVLFLIAAVQRFYLNILMPVTRIYILLVMAGHIAREDMLSRLTDLLKTGIEWGIRSLLGVVLGFQVIQGMVLPFADSIQTAGVQKVLQVIPGVGQGASAVTKLLLGSGVLIKNTMGAAAVVVLLLISIIPVLKLLILLSLYRIAAAVMQPVCDKRLVACISNVADGQKLLLNLVLSTLLLFILTIALICVGTNVSYLA